MLELRVPAVPVAQPRVRAAARFGKATMYTPTKIKAADGTKKDHPIVAFKATVRMAFERKFSGSPFVAPLRVDCCFVMPRPQKLMRKSDPPGRIPHAQKPDRDNLDKAVLDALKGLAPGIPYRSTRLEDAANRRELPRSVTHKEGRRKFLPEEQHSRRFLRSGAKASL